MSATAAGHGLVFEDLLDFPDDGFKRELIGGRLVVTPDQPTLRHQRVGAESPRRFWRGPTSGGAKSSPARTSTPPSVSTWSATSSSWVRISPAR